MDQPIQPQAQAPEQKPTKPKRSFLKKWWFWVVGIIILFLIVYIGFYLIPNKEKLEECINRSIAYNDVRNEVFLYCSSTSDFIDGSDCKLPKDLEARKNKEYMKIKFSCFIKFLIGRDKGIIK